MVNISKTAAKMFVKACESKNINPDEVYLRLYLNNRVPHLDIVSNKSSDDSIFNSRGITIVVDSVSMIWLGGANIDYQNGEYGSGFTINAPNACDGCSGDVGCCG